jgi:hypothetical protein
VGDGDDSAGEGSEELFEPLDGTGVEVVGGFIEQEHVGVTEEQLAECDAAFFTAGKDGDFLVGRRELHGVGGDFECAVEFPEVAVIDFVLDASLFVERAFHFVGRKIFAELHAEFVEAIEDAAGFDDGVFDAFADGFVGIEPWFLGNSQSGCLWQAGRFP